MSEGRRISIPEIGKLPYMQRKEQFISEVKLNTMKFRRLSIPNGTNFVRAPIKSFKENETIKNKENICDTKNERHRFLTTKDIPGKMQKVNSDEIEENTSIMMDYREQDLLTASISFNQSIGLIHFCRIGFKLSQDNFPLEMKNMVKSIILKILEEIKIKVS